ncbi:uncharacterized protein LOC124180780 isoform X1 [Neodiprion fabricii]|uniref:uncharacterized protein LOC124180780 isoform X1 n=2 Tax=Neodiprion fabricii TaxID=2872261 RepID=UPI001ED8E03F|nr:uncharacterized protein LOC124180780 isoform X1 [Neodiprion fabricii]
MFAVSFSCILFLLIRLSTADHMMQLVIKAFSEYNSVHCHILLFSSAGIFYEQRALVDFYKATILNNYAPTVMENIIDESGRSNTLYRQNQCVRPLRSFIMGNVSNIAKYMVIAERSKNTLKDTWLLFVKDSYEQELIISQVELSIRSEVYIARRTVDGYEFWEIYQTAKRESISVIYYGNWTIDAGLTVTELSILERRHNFRGAVLRAIMFETDRYTEIKESLQTRLMKCVWNLLEKKLNFTTKPVVLADNYWEHRVHNNKWNDIIVGLLAENKADVSMIAPSVESFSPHIIDQSGLLDKTEYRIFLKKWEVGLDSWFHFFDPLRPNVWYLTVFMTVMLSVMILLMNRLACKVGLMKSRYYYSDVCIALHRMLCLQGGDIQQEMSSMSLLFVFINFWAYLIQIMYSAALASSMAIKHYEVPFHSFKELLADGNYEFGVHRYSLEYALFYKTNDTFLMKLNTAMMEQNVSKLPTTYLQGLQRVCSENKYAFMASKLQVFELQSQLPCELHYLTDEEYTVNSAYAMSKHNEYLPLINGWLCKLKETGLISKINRNVLGLGQQFSDDSRSFRSRELQDTIILQLLFIVGIVLSIVTLFAERTYNRMRRNGVKARSGHN